MSKVLLALVVIFLSLGGGFFIWFVAGDKLPEKGIIAPSPTPKPLLVFTFDNLAQRKYEGSSIEIGEIINDKNEDYIAHLFTFWSDKKKVTGQINFPLTEKSKKMPVIVLLRGYVNQEDYQTEIGTEKAAGVFAQNGYIRVSSENSHKEC